MPSYLLRFYRSPDLDDPFDGANDEPLAPGSTPPAASAPAAAPTSLPEPTAAPLTPEGLGVGPALGDLASSDTLTIAQIMGAKPGATPAAPAATTGQAPAATAGTPPAAAAPAAAINYAGFASPKEFAETVLGQKDGVIEWEDGQKTPFADLTPQEQQQVIGQWRQGQPSKEELDMLHQVRAAGGFDGYLGQQLQQLTTSPTTFSEDQVLRTIIARESPDADDATVQAAIDYEKKNPRYQQRLEGWRQQLVGEQQAQLQKVQEAEANLFTQTARGIQSVGGILLTDQHRGELLNDVLQPDEKDPSVTKFVKTLENPQEMIQAAWWRRYGPPLLEAAIKQGFLKPAAAGAPGAPPAAAATGTPAQSNVVDLME